MGISTLRLLNTHSRTNSGSGLYWFQSLRCLAVFIKFVKTASHSTRKITKHCSTVLVTAVILTWKGAR